MLDETAGKSREPTKAEAAASVACTRSGAFALLLSMALFLLVPYWEQVPAAKALGDYLDYRYELTADLERLDHDPFWQQYKTNNPNVESSAISSIPDRVPYSPASGSKPTSESPESSLVKSGSLRRASLMLHPTRVSDVPPATTDPPSLADQLAQAPVSPGCRGGPSLPKGVPVPICPPTVGAPTVTTLYPIPELSDIIVVLKDLNTPGLLTKSRNYSNFYAFSIGRWAVRRSSLMYENAIHNVCVTRTIELPDQNPPQANFVPEIDHDALLNCLTLNDVRELATYEPPIVENPDQIGRGIQRPIDVGLDALPKGIVPASIVAEVLLVFALLYFGVFVREATTSDAFPVSGTLFSAFSRSRFTLSVMLILLCTPVVSCSAIAIASGRWFLYAGICLVASATWFIFSEFHRRSYFSHLDPLKWPNWKTKQRKR
jgi:hypothetical protein